LGSSRSRHLRSNASTLHYLGDLNGNGTPVTSCGRSWRLIRAPRSDPACALFLPGLNTSSLPPSVN
jgi:hypothetical protein